MKKGLRLEGHGDLPSLGGPWRQALMKKGLRRKEGGHNRVELGLGDKP